MVFVVPGTFNKRLVLNFKPDVNLSDNEIALLSSQPKLRIIYFILTFRRVPNVLDISKGVGLAHSGVTRHVEDLAEMGFLKIKKFFCTNRGFYERRVEINSELLLINVQNGGR